MIKATQMHKAFKSKVALPRYGFMNSAQDDAELDTKYMIPGEFEKGCTPKERREKWQAWTANQISLLEKCFGPVWGGQHWSRHWVEITKADLSLMRDLCKANWDRAISSVPSVQVKHSELFESEDDGNVEETIVAYTPRGTFSNSKLAFLLSTENEMLSKYLGTVHLTIKRAFQRPRPNQAAGYLIEDNEAKNFHFVGARSAWTPAFLSGHALEYGLSFLGIQDAFEAEKACATIIRACAHMVTDVGDRRVFAGVHYPSDSLASWLILANILNQYPKLRHMRAVFSNQLETSPVYTAIKSAKTLEEAKVYSKGLDKLHGALCATP